MIELILELAPIAADFKSGSIKYIFYYKVHVGLVFEILFYILMIFIAFVLYRNVRFYFLLVL